VSSEVEIRIMIRDGTVAVGSAASDSNLPTPDADMGGGASTASSATAPSPGGDGAGAIGAGSDAPSPTSVGAFEGVAASGELPTPLPLDEVAKLTGTSSSEIVSDAPTPDDDQG